MQALASVVNRRAQYLSSAPTFLIINLSTMKRCCFCTSPFERDVTYQFLDMVRKFLAQNPRDLFLVIDEFRFPELLENDQYFDHTLTYRLRAAVFDVYGYRAS